MKLKTFKFFILLSLFAFIFLTGCDSNQEIVYKESEKEDWKIVVRNEYASEKLQSFSFSEIDLIGTSTQDEKLPVEIFYKETGTIYFPDLVVKYKDKVLENYFVILNYRFFSINYNEPVAAGKNVIEEKIPIQYQGRYYLDGYVVKSSSINEKGTAYGSICSFGLYVYVEKN